ncbi:MAG: response regulator [Deltaproteobacteria bacterium]|nr:response regulator [Deltaproteobacteria bacterium]
MENASTKTTIGFFSIKCENEYAKAFTQSLKRALPEADDIGGMVVSELSEVLKNSDILIVNLTEALEEKDEDVIRFLKTMIELEEFPRVLFIAPEPWDEYNKFPEELLDFNGFKPFKWLALLLKFINCEYVPVPATIKDISSKIEYLRKREIRKNLSKDFWQGELNSYKNYLGDYVKRVAQAFMGVESEEGEIRAKTGEIVSRVLKKTAESLGFRLYLNINDYLSDREQTRRDIFHGLSYEDNPCLVQAYKEFVNLCDLCIAIAYHKSIEEYKVLIVDNHITKGDEPFIEKIRGDMERILRYFGEMDFYLIEESFVELKEALDSDKFIIDKGWLQHFKFHGDEEKGEWQVAERNEDIHDFRLILQDISLDLPDLTGEDFLSLYLEKCPEVPVFVFSGSEDYDTVKRTLNSGADYFIHKRDTLSLPLKIQDYHRGLGKLLEFIKNPELQRVAVGNIRQWRIDRNILWHGNKCFHMVDHSYEHTNNVWELANDLLCPVLDENKDLFSDEDIFCLSMAIWLHDIGHRGNDKYGAIPKIRANHGVIASELILSQPELYGLNHRKLYCDDKNDCITCIRDVDKHKMCKLKKIALICKYHQSNTPIDDEGYRELMEKKKLIPDECYENNERSKLLTLKKYNKNICKLASILRLVDGIDTAKNRVGERISRDIRKQTVSDEIEFYKKQLREYVKSKIGKSQEVKFDEKKMNELFKNFFSETPGELLDKNAGGLDDVINKQFEYLTRDMLDLREYYTNLDHISTLAKQEEYHALHGTVDKIEIEYDKNNLNLRYICNDIDKLRQGKVEGKSIAEQICEDVRKEWRACKTYLSDFLEPGRIIFCHRNGEKIECDCLGLAEELTWIDDKDRE